MNEKKEKALLMRSHQSSSSSISFALLSFCVAFPNSFRLRSLDRLWQVGFSFSIARFYGNYGLGRSCGNFEICFLAIAFVKLTSNAMRATI